MYYTITDYIVNVNVSKLNKKLFGVDRYAQIVISLASVRHRSLTHLSTV